MNIAKVIPEPIWRNAWRLPPYCTVNNVGNGL